MTILKEDIDKADALGEKIFQSIIDQVVFGPEVDEQQIKLIYAYISAKAQRFAEE